MEMADHRGAERGVLHKPWEHTALKVLSWGGLATASMALIPVLFTKANGSLGIASDTAIRFCTDDSARGLAGSAAGILEGIPLIGGSIAAGGFAAAAISGGLAIGGMWLANRIDKRTEKGEFRWGSVIRWAALSTSILIALPAILPAISMGTMFFASLLGSTALASAAGAIGALGSAGAMSGVSSALGAAGLAGVHALTCALPLGVTGFFLGQKEENLAPPQPRLAGPAQYEGPMQPLPPLRAAAL